MSVLTTATSNPNICGKCLKDHPAYTVADTGICGVCNLQGEVFDLDLLQVYKSVGHSDEVIGKHLPRLRNPFIHPVRSGYALTDLKERASHLAETNLIQLD